MMVIKEVCGYLLELIKIHGSIRIAWKEAGSIECMEHRNTSSREKTALAYSFE